MARYTFGFALGLLLAGSGMPADAGNAHAAAAQIESSLIVTGSIVVAPDGTVQSYALASTNALGAQLEEFLKNNITHWKFKPVEVDGHVVTAKSPMSLQLIANHAENNGMSVRIANIWFGTREDHPATENPQITKKLMPPRYPYNAMRDGGQGIVYLVVNIGRDGKVLEVDAEKVNLRSLGTDQQMQMLREVFTDASIRAAKQWIFQPPTTGPGVADGSWRVRVPVEFTLEKSPSGEAGHWQSYIPDPNVHVIPWAQEELRTAGSPDALPGNGIYPLQQGLQLLNLPSG